MAQEQRIAVVSEEDLQRIRSDYEQLKGRMERAEDDLNRFWWKATLLSVILCVVCSEVFGHVGDILGGLLI